MNTNMRLVSKRLFAVVMVGLTLGALGCQHEEHHELPAPIFKTTKPMRQDTELARSYVAQIRAKQHIELRALERGYLTKIFVDEGQPVKAGDRMFQIMPMVYQAEVRKAAAEAEYARIEYQNTKMLRDGNVVSRNELALAKARQDKAQAEYSLAKAHLSLTEIKAPFDGIMGRLRVRRGSLVDEGELLTTLSDNRTMWVYFNVDEGQYIAYQALKDDPEATKVELELANGTVFPQPGKIDTIEADFNPETGNIAFRASFPNPDGLLRYGQTGRVRMTSTQKDALLVPQKATFDVLDRQYVYVVDGEGKVRAQEIKVSAELPQVYVVADGLKGDEVLLLEGLRKVHEGQQIEQEFTEPQTVFAALEPPTE